MATVAVPASTRQITYEDLYARWEKGNWRSTDIDFSQDRIDWHERMTPEQRRGALWLYTLFFHGEDSVADNLSPYIDAAPTEEQTYFLTTQQVDEARHAVFFKRFLHEVVGLGDGTTGSALAATESHLTWGHRQTFARLDRMAAELRANPSKEQLAKAITLYHIVVEATLAQPGQHMIDRSLEELDLLPGFRSGMANVALDEQRHIAFGVKLLSDLLSEDPAGIEPAIMEVIREVMPWSLAVAYPPGGDPTYTESFGFSLLDLYEEGARTSDARLRAIGLVPEEIVGFPIPVDKPMRERAERGLRMLESGLLGPPNGGARRDPETVELLFDSIRRTADHREAKPGTVIQWDFKDVDPWYLTLDNGSTTVAQGRASDPSLTLKVAWQDWVDVSAGRADPRLLVLRGRLRPRGDLRVLLRMSKVFG